MEPIGAFFDGEWESSFTGILSNVEADHFIAQEHGVYHDYGNTFINNGIISSNFLPMDDTDVNISEIEINANLCNFVNSFHTNFHHFSNENSTNNSGTNSPFFLTQSYENNYSITESNQVSDNGVHEYVNVSSNEFFVPQFPLGVMEDYHFMKTEMASESSGNGYNQVSNTVGDLGEELKLKRKIDMQDHEASGDEKKNGFNGSPKKKPRLPRDAQKGTKRNTTPKKNKKISIGDTEEENDGVVDTQTHPSSCSSEDDNSNIVSPDSNGEVNAAVNSSGKTRASRGAATDPQSLYARRRREKINQRLKILQNLVPNGTKVDISTMLEEAVQYVKFLQLQIKLLSSDDMWMYAPIAYNGMDMGLSLPTYF